MRVMPVSTKSYRSFQPQKNQNANISFGNYESEEAKKLTYETAISDYEDYPEKVKKDPHSNYAFFIENIKEEMEYLDKTPYATVKKWNGSDGEKYVYVALNRDVTDKHENKKLFDDIAEHAQSFSYGIGEEIASKDPDFIGVIDSRIRLVYIHEYLHDAEIAHIATSSSNDNYSSSQQDDDLWLEAVSREIHS